MFAEIMRTHLMLHTLPSRIQISMGVISVNHLNLESLDSSVIYLNVVRLRSIRGRAAVTVERWSGGGVAAEASQPSQSRRFNN